MGAAFDGVDVVHERVEGLGVAVVVLDRNFDFDVIFGTLEVDRFFEDWGFALVEIFDKFGEAAFGKKRDGFVFGPVVDQVDLESLVEESQFAQA